MSGVWLSEGFAQPIPPKPPGPLLPPPRGPLVVPGDALPSRGARGIGVGGKPLRSPVFGFGEGSLPAARQMP